MRLDCACLVHSTLCSPCTCHLWTCRSVWDSMPLVAGATVVVIFVFMIFSFRSVVVALRSVLTVTLTVAWVFGFNHMIYLVSNRTLPHDTPLPTPWLCVQLLVTQCIIMMLVWLSGCVCLLPLQGKEKALEWTGWDCFQPQEGMYWLSPVLAFAVIVGVSLDYDVFILVRVREFRWQGYSNREAVLLGLTRTGGIITAAGIIMGACNAAKRRVCPEVDPSGTHMCFVACAAAAVAFSALLASSTMLLNMIGSYLVFAVLFDTFIVRRCVCDLLLARCLLTRMRVRVFAAVLWCPPQ